MKKSLLVASFAVACAASSFAYAQQAPNPNSAAMPANNANGRPMMDRKEGGAMRREEGRKVGTAEMRREEMEIRDIGRPMSGDKGTAMMERRQEIKQDRQENRKEIMAKRQEMRQELKQDRAENKQQMQQQTQEKREMKK